MRLKVPLLPLPGLNSIQFNGIFKFTNIIGFSGVTLIFLLNLTQRDVGLQSSQKNKKIREVDQKFLHLPPKIFFSLNL